MNGLTERIQLIDGLIWQPYGTLAAASGSVLGKMRFDKDHYRRAYTLCRGRGGGKMGVVRFGGRYM